MIKWIKGLFRKRHNFDYIVLHYNLLEMCDDRLNYVDGIYLRSDNE